jgi:hypothetical protein
MSFNSNLKKLVWSTLIGRTFVSDQLKYDAKED